MKNSQLTTRRVSITLSGTVLATTSGCLSFLGIGSEAESREGSDSGDSTTNGFNTDDDFLEAGPNSSKNTLGAEHEIDETNEAGSEENEASVPESNPQNDPSQTGPADPNTTEPPSSNDIELIESAFSTSVNEAIERLRIRFGDDFGARDLKVKFSELLHDLSKVLRVESDNLDTEILFTGDRLVDPDHAVELDGLLSALAPDIESCSTNELDAKRKAYSLVVEFGDVGFDDLGRFRAPNAVADSAWRDTDLLTDLFMCRVCTSSCNSWIPRLTSSSV